VLTRTGTSTHAGTLTDSQPQTDRQTDRHRQTDRRMDGQSHTHTHAHTRARAYWCVLMTRNMRCDSRNSIEPQLMYSILSPCQRLHVCGPEAKASRDHRIVYVWIMACAQQRRRAHTGHDRKVEAAASSSTTHRCQVCTANDSVHPKCAQVEAQAGHGRGGEQRSQHRVTSRLRTHDKHSKEPAAAREGYMQLHASCVFAQ
jgi:hypothetical protein